MTTALSNPLNLTRSQALSQEIARLIPGGVDSPFRSFHEVGGHTIFFNKALGSKLYDVDGNVYIDYLGSWGPAILGHCPPAVVAACQEQISRGAVFGAPHELELELARKLTETMPSMQQVRFVNSGTEAVMSAIRLARGYTGRNLIVTFTGSYHGHCDSVLASRTHTASSGVPEASAQNTLQVPYNSLDALKLCLEANAGEIAAVLIEPVCGSMGVVPPEPGYLQGVEKLCRQHACLFICDEVLTGLRCARGGAQSVFGVTPDLTCLGKALGGGMPIGAYGGKAEIMSELMPLGKVYQAGTFSGNPVTMAGGIATLSLLASGSAYEDMEKRAQELFAGLARAAAEADLPVQLQRVGSMFAILFTERPVKNYSDHLTINQDRFNQFFHLVLARGIYLPPSAVDAACLSAAHTTDDIAETVAICQIAFEQIATTARTTRV